MNDPISRTENLTKELGKPVVIDDVTLDAERGEFRSLIDPNGTGRTTAFNLLTGALRPTHGTTTFNGKNVTTLPPYERVRRGLGWSFQITNVFSGLTVRESVRLVAQVAREGGLTPVETHLRRNDTFDDTNGHTDCVLDRSGLLGRGDEPADVLAYGDKRRLRIVIVLAIGPGVVLLDEPTAGTSAEETRVTMDLVDEVLSDRTLLLIRHDIDLVVRVSDRTAVLHRDEVLVEGAPTAVSEDPKVHEVYSGGVGT